MSNRKAESVFSVDDSSRLAFRETKISLHDTSWLHELFSNNMTEGIRSEHDEFAVVSELGHRDVDLTVLVRLQVCDC